MRVTADFSRTVGEIKPMHGVGQPPFIGVRDQWNYMHFLAEAGIPYSRLHDVGGDYGGFCFVDIPNIFRDFDADVNDPASYDFVFTDWLIQEIDKQGTQTFYRLGITIENNANMRAYYTAPPKDYFKWAQICEHIIRHYNEGWADGFHMGIRYWEIWNEPEGHTLHEDQTKRCMWSGSQEDYFRLYDVASKHLKACFGNAIKVGGYASHGFYEPQVDPDFTGIDYEKIPEDKIHRAYWMQYAHDFLRYINEAGSPLDFFSWHSYDGVAGIVRGEEYCEKLLAHYGREDAEVILDEWHPYHGRRGRGTPADASNTLAVMLAMQKTSASLLTYYDARVAASPYAGMFNPDTITPNRTYFTFMAFNHLYRLKNEVFTETDADEVYVCGACDEHEGVILLANVGETCELEFELSGIETDRMEILMIDDVYAYSPTGKRLIDRKLKLSANSCTEIRFYR